VPQQILYDRMKTVVIRDDAEAGHIIYNRTLLDFARHHDYLPKACRAYRAQTKGKVERPFRYIREDFFLGGRFRNLDDLNAQFRQWQDEVANARVHATTRHVCNSASNWDPTSYAGQTIEVADKTEKLPGSRSAPIGTPANHQIPKLFQCVGPHERWGPNCVLNHSRISAT
jgi:hypothetical protein